MPTSLRRWLAVVIGEGGGFCDAVFFVHAHRALADGGRRGAARGRRACRGLRALEGAPSGDDRAGRGLHRGDPRGVALRARSIGSPRLGTGPVAYPVAVGVAAAGHGIALRARAARLSARRCGQSDFGRRAPHSARPDRRPARARRARAGGRGDGARARSPRRSTRSAARRSAPTSRACMHETQYTRLFRS